MNTKDLRDLSAEELSTKEGELRHELLNLRFQHATRQLENTARIQVARREIARVLTVLRERELKNA
ncbi:MAG: 50S ribosomal protein L29 [Deltaproteobacteria bacterium]|nr:50S ribosomal protein L29 [Deltaproteobacteria bacterium]